MIVRLDALKILAAHRGDQIVVVATMSMPDWWSIANNRDLDFPAIGAMGHATSLGLGFSLARPDRQVWILNGDGSQLMNLGSLATIAHNHPKNLVLFVLQNDTYETTGRQPIPGAGKIDFAAAAKAIGFPNSYDFDQAARLQAALPGILRQDGPTLVNIRVSPTPAPDPRWQKPNLYEESAKIRQVLASQPRKDDR